MSGLTMPHDAQPESLPLGRLHRITRLMALAIKYDGLIRSRVLLDYSDIARLGRISKPRVTQIMNLLNLAPDIQERLLFLPRTTTFSSFSADVNVVDLPHRKQYQEPQRSPRADRQRKEYDDPQSRLAGALRPTLHEHVGHQSRWNQQRTTAKVARSDRQHEFLEEVYKEKRLHSALGYVPPAEFERNLSAQKNKDAAAENTSPSWVEESSECRELP